MKKVLDFEAIDIKDNDVLINAGVIKIAFNAGRDERVLCNICGDKLHDNNLRVFGHIGDYAVCVCDKCFEINGGDLNKAMKIVADSFTEHFNLGNVTIVNTKEIDKTRH